MKEFMNKEANIGNRIDGQTATPKTNVQPIHDKRLALLKSSKFVSFSIYILSDLKESL